MIQKLIILGLLKNGELHGYEIKKFIEKDLGIFTSLNNSSIYYPLKVMEQERLIAKRLVGGKKNLNKYVYRITKKGEAHFLDLATKNLRSPQRPFINFDLSLYFLPFLQKRKVIASLRMRVRFLESVKRWLQDKMKDDVVRGRAHLKLLLEHHQALAKAELRFTKDFVTLLKSE